MSQFLRGKKKVKLDKNHGQFFSNDAFLEEEKGIDVVLIYVDEKAVIFEDSTFSAVWNFYSASKISTR